MPNEWIDMILKAVQVQVQRGIQPPFVAAIHPDNFGEVNASKLFTAWGDVDVTPDFRIAEDAVVVMTKQKWETRYAQRQL
jgi:hypothetical protein